MGGGGLLSNLQPRLNGAGGARHDGEKEIGRGII